MKPTVFYKSDHANIIISDSDITLKNTIHLSYYNFTITYLSFRTKSPTPYPITFIHQNKHAYKTVNPDTYTPQCPLCLPDTHETNFLFDCSQVSTQRFATST